MANMTISNATANPVVITGDAGIPRIKVAARGTATVGMSKVAGNEQFCDELSAYITAGTLTAVVGTTTVTTTLISGYKDGDMGGAVYDADGDGYVDEVDAGGAAGIAIAAATAHAASDGSSHTFIDQDVTSGAAPVLAVTNMTGSAAGLDSDATAHAAADGSSHTFIDQDVTSGAAPVFAVTNMTGSAAGLDSDATAHAASAGLDHSYIADNLVQVVITATGGSGGAVAGTISVQVNDLGGTAVTRAVNIRLDISDTDMAGPLDAAATCQFGAATTGTLVVGNGAAAAIVTTDATGLYEGALSNAADETNYFSATTSPGGAATLANACVVAECATDSATWSA